MEMQAVESSNIAGLGHEPKSNVLRVWFKSGTAYDYQNVSTELYGRLVGAESVGKAFHAHIKTQPSNHPFKKVA